MVPTFSKFGLLFGTTTLHRVTLVPSIFWGGLAIHNEADMNRLPVSHRSIGPGSRHDDGLSYPNATPFSNLDTVRRCATGDPHMGDGF